MSQIDVSVIIVNFNTKDLLQNCLRSIYEQTANVTIEVLVSDNGSTDGSLEMVRQQFPQTILLENNANLGFGKANNIAAKQAHGKYIFYLNSDTELKNNAIKYFFDYWENATEKNDIGALGCNLLDRNGNYMHSFASFPSYKKLFFEPIKFFITAHIKSFFLLFFKRIPDFSKAKHFEKHFGEVGYITGADLFLRNDENAFFDERYFMYYEECDLELKLAQQGKKRLIIDGPEIFHLENGSDKNKKGYSYSSIFNEISRIKYIRKNMRWHFYIPVVKLFVILTWLHPVIYPKAKKYFSEYLKA